MILKGSHYTVAFIPLCDLHVNAGEYQLRSPERVIYYMKLMQEHPHDAPGLLFVQPSPYHKGAYEILDGHHRFCAHILVGRAEALCLIIVSPA